MDDKGIPMQYLQIDSYWYYKGKNGGVTNWSATPEAFPGGLAALSEETGARKRRLFEPLSTWRSFCQDRLGTNIQES